MKKLLLVFIISVSICIIAYLLSFQNAKRMAFSILDPIKETIEYKEFYFEPLIRFQDKPQKAYYSLWCFSFCVKNSFCCFPFEVYISFAGNVIMTNPTDLSDRIIKKASIK